MGNEAHAVSCAILFCESGPQWLLAGPVEPKVTLGMGSVLPCPCCKVCQQSHRLIVQKFIHEVIFKCQTLYQEDIK